MRPFIITALCSLVSVGGMVVSPLTSLARDDRYDERTESRTEERLSAREQQKFDAFLDAHEETATELEREPTLINNERFLRRHTELRNWLEDNPRIAETLQADPQAVLGRGRTATRRAPEERRSAAGQMDERDLRGFETYLDTHDETAQQLYQNPDLVNDRQFVRDHDALNDWLRGHPEAARAIRADPDKYLWRERTTNAQDFLRQLFGR